MVLTVLEAKKLTVPRLKEELTKRGLDSTGNKPDLLARLTESINQAAEDLILSDAGVADHHLLNDDILNDDLLDVPSIDGDEDVLAAVGETASTDSQGGDGEKSAEPKKEIVLTEKPADGGVEEAQRARAIRFGLPLTSEMLGSDNSKTARAKRFGLPEDAKRLSSDDMKAKRAERFGLPTASDAGTSDEQKAARAARFGLPVGGPKGEDAEKLAARAKRFSTGKEDDEETKAKKLARLERFGAGVN